MKPLDLAGPIKRRRFFSSLTALGAMFGGIVPELRAQTAVTGDLASTPESLPLIPPLSASTVAIMYASAKKDENARKLLIDAGSGLVASAPDYSYDMGGRGRYITIPLRNSSTGELSSYLFYGTLSSTDLNGKKAAINIAFSLRAAGDLRFVDRSGTILPGPPETQPLADAFYSLFLPQQYFATRVRPRDETLLEKSDCQATFENCTRTARWQAIYAAGWGAACLACIAFAIYTAPISGGASLLWAIRVCAFPCAGGSLAKLKTWRDTLASCQLEWEMCIGVNPPPIPLTPAPSPPGKMPIPPMASPPGVPSGMPTPPFPSI